MTASEIAALVEAVGTIKTELTVLIESAHRYEHGVQRTVVDGATLERLRKAVEAAKGDES